VTLARDATSAGDPVLAESITQHSEHYQRMINEMTGSTTSKPPAAISAAAATVITGDEPQPELSVEQPSLAQRLSSSNNSSLSDGHGGGLEDLDRLPARSAHERSRERLKILEIQ